MKFLLRLVGLLVVLVVIAAVAAMFLVDRLARGAVETGATYALGVPTKLGSADVKVLAGEFEMGALNVSNPDGFDSPHFLRLDNGGVAVSLGSLREDVVELPHLTLAGLDMHLQRGGSGANYQVILGNLKRFESGDPAGDAGDKDGKRFVIRKVEIRDVNVHVDLAPVGGDLTKIDVPIEVIELTDVGSGTGGGVLLTELSGVLVKALLAAIVDKGGGLIPADVLGELTSGLGDLSSLSDMGIGMVSELGGSLDEIAGQATDALGDVTGTVDDAKGKIDDLGNRAGDAINNLGGLLGGDKDDK
ncbi:MAG: hypothetical protein ACYTG1_06630 [Planctomycetota bacterium]|jgi:hypothetical protein